MMGWFYMVGLSGRHGQHVTQTRKPVIADNPREASTSVARFIWEVRTTRLLQ